MKNAMIYQFLTVIFLSCSSLGIIGIEPQKSRLCDEELNHIVSLLENDIEKEINYHILYQEIFNDSTFLLSVCQSTNTVTEDFKFRNSIKNKNGYIFVYDLKEFNDIIDKKIQSNTNQVPFFTPGEKQWKLLVRRRNGILIVEQLVVMPITTRVDIDNTEGF